MTEPTAASVDSKPWEEARPPHLPDTLTGIPRAVWPFVGLAVLVAVTEWYSRGGSIVPVTVPDPWILLGMIMPVATALTGAALFWRHPDARRSMPRLAASVTTFAVVAALSLLVNPMMGVLVPESTPDDMGQLVLTSTLLRLPISIIGIAGLVWLVRGLDDAPRPRPSRTGRTPVIIGAVAIGAWAGLSLSQLPFLTDDTVPGSIPLALVGQAIGALSLFATWLLTLAALRGLRGGATPPVGWAFVLVAGVVAIATSIAMAILLFVSTAFTVDVFTGFQVLEIPGALPAVLLLGAFAVGLPAAAVVAPPSAAEDSPFEEDRTVRIG